jgi:hypothetical protein
MCRMVRWPCVADSDGHLCDLMALFWGDAYLRCLASLGSLSWPFLLRIHPSEPSAFPSHSSCLIDSSFGEIGEHPSALLWVIVSRGTWWLCFIADFACYSWWLLTPRWLGAARIVERRKVIVSGSNRGDCEEFLTFTRRRAKRYSSGLLIVCGSSSCVGCAAPDCGLGVWTFKWVNRYNEDVACRQASELREKNHCVILSPRNSLGFHCNWLIVTCHGGITTLSLSCSTF